MTRILLVSSNLTTDPYPVHPLGLAALAAALRSAGHEVRQFDALACGDWSQALPEVLEAFQPEVVGLSIRNLDTCDALNPTSYPASARDMVAVVRACTTAKVVLGGAAFSMVPETLLAFTGADHGIVGEGETLLPALVARLEAGEQPEPILRNPQPLALGTLPAPQYDPTLVRHYLDHSGLVNLQTKRGCPHRCAYCSYPTLEGARYRFRDPKAVAEDLARLHRDHPDLQVFFTDSVFNDAQGHYLEVAEALLARSLKVPWACYLRPAGLGRRELALLKRAGLMAAELGTDATTDATLAGLDKGFSFDDVLAFHEACLAETLPVAHFVMFGGPGETPDTVEAGLANLERLRHTLVFAYAGIRIFPGTPLEGRARREGLLAPEADLMASHYHCAPGLDLEARLTAAFRGRRDRFFPPSRASLRMETLRRMGLRGLIWPTLIRFPEVPC